MLRLVTSLQNKPDAMSKQKKTQITNLNSEETERNLVTTNENLQDSLSAEL
ncbi:18944_t:CDS:2 [Dentiscutata erythropus]|uniref:18944_t:CDS:1 n=1 Tax=Dentiscutata erythropus TaxID=1348616 RepID=A0A9N9BA99_9GLOM|nr:18944_t:CDS:2 [Dentiscutata erythropus]